MTWKVTGGHFNSVNSGIKQLFNTSDKVAVFWDNVTSVNGGKTTGTVEVEVYISSQQKTLKGKYVQNIKSLNGVSMTKLETNISTELPYEIKEFRVVADKLQFPKLTYDNGDPLNAIKYEWTLPSGWKSKSGKTGTFILEQPIPILDVITDANTTGTIKVRAINDCLGLEDASEFSELKFTRKGLGLGEFPQTVPLGEEKTYTFSVVGTEGTFEWKAPAGWKINGGGNTFTGGKSVQITTSKCPTRDSVQVRLSGTIPWTKFPTIIQLPAINVPSGEIKQYQSVTFSLNMTDTDIAFVEWFANGNSVGSAANTSVVTFPMNVAGNVKISAKLTLNGCSSVTIPEIEVDVIKAPDPIISGPSTVCDQAAYTIANLPPGATMQWSAINSNLQLVSAQDSTAVFRKISNGKSTLRAILAIGDSSITLNRAVDVGVPLRPWIMNDTVINKGSSVSYDMCIGQGTTSLYLMLINPDNSADVGSWEVHKPANVDAFSIVQNGNHLFVNPLKKGGGFFTVTSHNACGSSEEMRIYLTITDCEGGTIPIDPPSLPTNFTLAPNPATDIVTVQLQEDTPAN
ncbi:MAG: hypothetical protein ACOYEG_04265 [Petrimonas sp.]|jgi:hypothetical protein